MYYSYAVRDLILKYIAIQVATLLEWKQIYRAQHLEVDSIIK